MSNAHRYTPGERDAINPHEPGRDMTGGTLRRSCFAALVCIMATAGAAAAQRDSLTQVHEDSLGLAADAEPIPHRRLRGMGQCGVIGHAAVKDTAELRRLRMYPPCADAPFPEPVGRTLVSVSVRGDCHTVYRLHAFRSESRREFRVRLQRRNGGCRAGRFADAWLELPALPEGWRITLTDEVVDREVEVDLLGGDGWTSIRSRDERE